jgi:hypothetical protein
VLVLGDIHRQMNAGAAPAPIKHFCQLKLSTTTNRKYFDLSQCILENDESRHLEMYNLRSVVRIKLTVKIYEL